MKITKAVIPAAGLGTRFLPYTKVVPKELLPILNKPALQLIIDEGLASSINSFTIIANDNKRAIREHLSPQKHLEEYLTTLGKEKLLDSVNDIITRAHFTYVPQEVPLGLGHAILMARTQLEDNYFGIFLPDEIMISTIPALAQLIAIAEKYNASVVAVQEVPQEKVSSYGIIAIKDKLEPDVFEIDHLVEKPSINTAPSRFAIVGRCVLSPRIFASLEQTPPGAAGEIQLTDGIMHMKQNGERVLAYNLSATRHDIGNPLGWLQANIHAGILNEHYREAIQKYCETLVKK